MEHGDTRKCTKCSAKLTWHADTRTWQGKHKKDCHVPTSMADKAMPTRVRGPREDEGSPIGANGQQLWRVTMQMGNPGAAFEEILPVAAATEDGAICLAQESRLNIAGILAEPA